jgi:Flp pilus assembly protein TadG
MRNFWHDRKGNVAILFALAIVPVMGAMGAALDYSRANAYRTDMQKAVDATALALSKVMPLNETKLNEVAKQYFAANMGNHDLTNLSLEVTPGQGTVQLAATGNYVPASSASSNSRSASRRPLAGASARWKSRSFSTTPVRWARFRA